MKIFMLCKRTMVAWIIILLFSTLCRAEHNSSQENILTQPYPFSTIVEFDPGTSTFYGRIKINKENYIASINHHTKKMKLLTKLPLFDGWYPSVSALDSKEKRFFFIVSFKKKPHLFTINTVTGKILNILALPHIVTNIVFDPLKKTILGIAHFNGEHLVSIDLSTGKLSKLCELNTIENKISGALLEKNTFIFVAYKEHKLHLYTLNIKTNLLKKSLSKYIGLNKYEVISFEKNKNLNILFTSGVQTCTAIAGYDPQSNIGFIAHFTPKYKKIDKALMEIEKKIQEYTPERGLKEMKIFVVGGVKNDQDSISNLNMVYSELLKVYDIDKNQIKKFNTGVAHTIIMKKEWIKVF